MISKSHDTFSTTKKVPPPFPQHTHTHTHTNYKMLWGGGEGGKIYELENNQGKIELNQILQWLICS